MEPPRNGVADPGDGVARCWWCVGDPLNLAYHDLEWGRPLTDDTRLFEKICLEGFQSGLSWLTILRKREDFRKAFKSFDIPSVARFNARSVDRLLLDAGIVRNRAKIEAAIANARAALDLPGGLLSHVHGFAPAAPVEAPRTLADLRAQSEESKALAKDLRKRGFRFVGPTTMYALMQAVGVVDDHLAGCPAREEIEAGRTNDGARRAQAPSSAP